MNMTPDEARAVERPTIEVGGTFEFYCEVQQEYEPPEQRLRRFTGQAVTVLRQLGPDEHDPDNSPAYEVQAADGTTFTAHEEELNGWDRDLGQFFWPDGTYGPNHDRQFLANEQGG